MCVYASKMFYVPCVMLMLLLTLVDPLLSIIEDVLLLYPKPSIFQCTVGLSMPIAKNIRGGLTFSSGFQFNYELPWNLTQFEPLIVRARSAPQVQQQLRLENLYTAIEELLERSGWEYAQECVLKTICEFAEIPFTRNGKDVVEEIIHLLLTSPSEDFDEVDYPGRWSEAHLYAEAERIGKNGTGCQYAFGHCSHSPLDFFTEILFRS